ncbi:MULTISPECIES: hypothetical protein [Lactobacillus]|uniref:Uncharacterized protein n=1 Tax=Lactobacillus xujianguonis TaxID=2495899 RepID=A0A437SVE4_9LACO|nr:MULTISPECIES: hypothetical protein [Lactobacillus]RVU70894.1 hypothetical protein EJK17_04885 [Lactobacillus xujianguonis]RVU73759.1 hypothetical protein EJK20_06540 [Lactobacillus xujianguonis]
MLYLLYILLGIIIILVVDCAVTAFLAIHDIFKYQAADQLTFAQAFKKYFAKNNNLPTHWSDIFNWE